MFLLLFHIHMPFNISIICWCCCCYYFSTIYCSLFALDGGALFIIIFHFNFCFLFFSLILLPHTCKLYQNLRHCLVVFEQIFWCGQVACATLHTTHSNTVWISFRSFSTLNLFAFLFFWVILIVFFGYKSCFKFVCKIRNKSKSVHWTLVSVQISFIFNFPTSFPSNPFQQHEGKHFYFNFNLSLCCWHLRVKIVKSKR